MNKLNDSKFVAITWNIGNGQSNANYDVGNKIIYNTEVFKSNICDYNVYILVRGDINVIAVPATQVSFKNYAPFTNVSQKLMEQKEMILKI